MHHNSYNVMRGLLARHPPLRLVYDVGAKNVNGTYRPLVTCRYEGVDIEAGENVTHVVPENGEWPLPAADMVISGNVLEHVKRPWRWMEQINSITDVGGRVIIVTPWNILLHRFPVDCWRVMPDGMEVLLEDGGFRVLEVGRAGMDTFGVGVKL